MRNASILFAAIGIIAIALLILIVFRDRENAYQVALIVLVVAASTSGWMYGERLANRDHTGEPDRFKPFTGTNNLPIFTALWRAAQAGDKAAKWATVAVYGGPLAALLIIVAPSIFRKMGF